VTRRLDHLVVVVPDLDEASAHYRARGFHVSPGGRHKAFGSANALIRFAHGPYLELFCFVEPGKASPDHPLWATAKAGGGLAVYWIGTDHIDEDVARLRANGFDYTAPAEMTRSRPDGVELRFRVATPNEEDLKQLPFLIQDLGDREDRLPPFVPHANGVTALNSVVVAVPSFTRPRSCLESILSAGGARSQARRLGPEALAFDIGDRRVVLTLSANRDGAAATMADGWGPYAITVPQPALIPDAPKSVAYDVRFLKS
jgi:hypothetical protein